MAAATESVEGDVAGIRDVDVSKVKSRLHHSLRTCSAAVKKARTFEIQRTVKKLKDSSTDVERRELEGVLEALKEASHGQVAALALKSKMVKAKLLPKGQSGANNAPDGRDQFPLSQLIEELQDALSDCQGEKIGDAHIEKAKSRLLSNKTVSEEVSRAVTELGTLLVPGKAHLHSSEKKAQGKPKVTDVRGERVGRRVEKAAGKAVDVTEPDSEEAGPDDDSQGRRMGKATQQVAGLTRNSSAKRQAEGRDEEDPRSSKRVRIATQAIVESKGEAKRDEDEDEDENDDENDEDGLSEESESDGDDVSDEDESPGRLPSLAIGFVAGKGLRLGRASDDEWSDGDADLESIDEEADQVGRPKESKKNRMGQRARRAIWEKKFGKGANHLKLLEKEPRRRDSRGDGQFKVVRGQARPPRSDSGWSSAPLRAPPSSVPVAMKSLPAKTEAEMHPSWIAKQKQKEKAEAALRSGGIAKKITFD